MMNTARELNSSNDRVMASNALSSGTVQTISLRMENVIRCLWRRTLPNAPKLSVRRECKEHFQQLQATQSYSIINLPAPPTDDPAGTDEIDIEYINQSTNIIAASDASVNPITGEAAFNWRITTYEKRGLITKSSFANSNPMYMASKTS